MDGTSLSSPVAHAPSATRHRIVLLLSFLPTDWRDRPATGPRFQVASALGSLLTQAASSSTYLSGRMCPKSTTSSGAHGSQCDWTRRRLRPLSPHRISTPTLPMDRNIRSFAAAFSTRPSDSPCSAPPRDMVRFSSTVSAAGRPDG